MLSRKFIAATRAVSSYDKPVPAPCLRRSFIVPEDLVQAKFTIAAPGFYELYLNGERITRGFLAPYLSNPDHFIYYDEYDLTARLRPGKNTLGILLGNGMQDCFGGHCWDFEKAPWRGSPRTAFALELTTSGSTQTIEADEGVLTADSPIFFNDLRSGERYDARREMPGWSLPEFDDSAWSPAIPVECPRGEGRIGIHAPIAVTREIAPVDVRPGRITHMDEPRGDINPSRIDVSADELEKVGILYDFGENAAGLCRLKIKGQPGQKIILQFGETLAEDGGLDLRNMQFMPPTFNQRDVYLLKGDPDGEVWTPCFTFHGFRYCLVMGMTEEQATPDALTYLVMNGDFQPKGEFSCSDPLANQLFEAIQRSNLANFYYFPTDCPHREKNGWTGDASVSAEQFMLSQSFDASIREWLNNVRAAQAENGSLPGIVPTGGWGYAWGNGPAWDAALFNLPFYQWKYRGDEEIVRENAAAMVRYLDYIFTRRDEKGLIHVGLGDWCQAEQDGAPLAPLALTDTLMILDIAQKAEIMLCAVGMNERAAYARILRDQLMQDARRELIDPATLTALGNCQASQAMAIAYGLFTQDEIPGAVEVLTDMIHQNDDLLKVGILGARVMFEVLAENGYATLAYAVAMTERFPSFGRWMAQGETALPENFQKPDDFPASRNHHFFGSILGFFMICVCGLQINPLLRDPDEIRISPRIPDQLNHAECWHETPAGRIYTSWEREKGEILLTVAALDGHHGEILLRDGWKFRDGSRRKILASGEYWLHK